MVDRQFQLLIYLAREAEARVDKTMAAVLRTLIDLAQQEHNAQQMANRDTAVAIRRAIREIAQEEKDVTE